MLSRALKMWFWLTYDHLGHVLLWNVACMLPMLLLTASAFGGSGIWALGCFALAYGIVLPASLAALGHTARVLLEQKEAPLRTLIDGLRAFAIPGALLGLLGTALCGGAFFGAWYYAFRFAQPNGLLGYALSAFCLWWGVLCATVLNLALPALAQKRAGAREALRLGIVLTLDNPAYVAVIFLYTVLLAAFALAPPVFLCFSVAPIAFLQATAYEMLARKYAAPLVDGKRVLTFDDDADDYLNRGARDLLFPWKF